MRNVTSVTTNWWHYILWRIFRDRLVPALGPADQLWMRRFSRRRQPEGSRGRARLQRLREREAERQDQYKLAAAWINSRNLDLTRATRDATAAIKEALDQDFPPIDDTSTKARPALVVIPSRPGRRKGSAVWEAVRERAFDYLDASGLPHLRGDWARFESFLRGAIGRHHVVRARSTVQAAARRLVHDYVTEIEVGNRPRSR